MTRYVDDMSIYTQKLLGEGERKKGPDEMQSFFLCLIFSPQFGFLGSKFVSRATCSVLLHWIT